MNSANLFVVLFRTFPLTSQYFFSALRREKVNGVVAKGLSFSLKFMIVRALESQTWAGCLARAYSEAT